MIEINKDTLLEFGFVVVNENKENGVLWLSYDIENWAIVYNSNENKVQDFAIEADGGHDFGGEFSLEHFKYINQIETLIKAMKGTL